ncbi:pilus assembly protein [Rhodobacteraceae bacterium M382]|nr:pilus assembly protein [Rhodobacteraceae bacterium M382]
MLKRLLQRLRDFAQRTDGNVSVEFVLAMPMVFWSFMAVYVFFDGYRQSTVNLKSAYTISDLLSRETNAVDDDYIDSMYSLLQVLTRSRSVSRLRVTVVRWDEDDARYYVDWSEARGYETVLTNATISGFEDDLPIMPDNERVILVETRNVFVPLFNVGMEDKNLDNFVFSRPRFAPKLDFDGPLSGGDDHDDLTGGDA